MNPLTRLFRRSRTFRVLLYVSTFPLWALILFVSFDSFGNYSEVGDVTILALIMLFALWAWWFDEDRSRRRVIKAKQAGGNGRPPTAN
jgi:membrane protease YdiL (CAAX protease family)